MKDSPPFLPTSFGKSSSARLFARSFSRRLAMRLWSPRSFTSRSRSRGSSDSYQRSSVFMPAYPAIALR